MENKKLQWKKEKKFFFYENLNYIFLFFKMKNCFIIL